MSNCDSTASFLRIALLVLKKEYPPVYGRLVTELDQASANFRVDDERFLIAVVKRDVKIISGRWSMSAKAEGDIGARDLFRLIDGTSTVSSLLNSERLKIRGDSDTLLRLDLVVRLFLEASLKSTTLQNHFEDYRRWASALPRRNLRSPLTGVRN